MVGGLAGPRVIGALGSRRALVLGFLAQAAATLPLAFLGTQPGWIVLVLAATFAGGIANLVAIVGFMVTATAGVPRGEQCSRSTPGSAWPPPCSSRPARRFGIPTPGARGSTGEE